MRHLKCLAATAAMLLTSGCLWGNDTVSVDLDYASSGYGYINSGDLQAGSLLLWNRSTGQIVHLSDVTGFTPPEHPRDKEFDFASYQSGADLGLGVKNTGLQAKADAVIASTASFKVSYPNVVTYDGYLTHLSNYITETLKKKPNLLDEWSFRSAVNNHDLYYLLVRKVTYGDGIRLAVDQEAKAEAGFTVLLRGAELNVKIKGKGLKNIKGTNTEIAFFMTALRPYWNDNGAGGQNPAFEPDHWVKFDNMPELLRRANLGTPTVRLAQSD